NSRARWLIRKVAALSVITGILQALCESGSGLAHPSFFPLPALQVEMDRRRFWHIITAIVDVDVNVNSRGAMNATRPLIPHSSFCRPSAPSSKGPQLNPLESQLDYPLGEALPAPA